VSRCRAVRPAGWYRQGGSASASTNSHHSRSRCAARRVERDSRIVTDAGLRRCHAVHGARQQRIGEEDHGADRVVAAHHVLAERLDHAARIGLQQDQPRRRDVQRGIDRITDLLSLPPRPNRRK